MQWNTMGSLWVPTRKTGGHRLTGSHERNGSGFRLRTSTPANGRTSTRSTLRNASSRANCPTSSDPSLRNNLGLLQKAKGDFFANPEAGFGLPEPGLCEGLIQFGIINRTAFAL